MESKRRTFCKGLCGAAGLAVVGATLPGCGDDDGKTQFQDLGPICGGPAGIGAGPAELIQLGQARLILSANIFVCHDQDGFYAMDAECSHIGTTVDFVDAQAGFKCPLHGSTFNFNGEQPTGPAMAPLPHYDVCATESGALIVDTSKMVDAKKRIKV